MSSEGCIFHHISLLPRSLRFDPRIFILEYLPENQGGMKPGSGEDAEGEECLVRLVENKSGSRVEWVLEMTGAERVAANSRSLDSAGSFAIANHPASFGMTDNDGTLGMTNLQTMVIPWMMAVADPKEKWWEWARKNPKQSGEISQAAFLLKARTMGFKVALPWGDSERYDFVVCGRRKAARCIGCR